MNAMTISRRGLIGSLAALAGSAALPHMAFANAAAGAGHERAPLRRGGAAGRHRRWLAVFMAPFLLRCGALILANCAPACNEC